MTSLPERRQQLTPSAPLRPVLPAPFLPGLVGPALMGEALRRRVYLWVIALGLVALSGSVLVQVGSRLPDYAQLAVSPVELLLCLWAIWWLMTGRTLPVVEQVALRVNAAAALVQLVLGLLAGAGVGPVRIGSVQVGAVHIGAAHIGAAQTVVLISSAYWTMTILATLGFLLLTSRQARRFVLGLCLPALLLPWLALLWDSARAGAETGAAAAGAGAELMTGRLFVPGDLLHVQFGFITVLILLSVLARYRDQFAAERGERLSLERLAYTDPMTGLPNRRALYPQIERLLDGVPHGLSGCLILLDLDHFKRVNDTCGHNVGDEVLIRVAATLRADLRATDTVGRWGGEEFLIVLPGLAPELGGMVAERLRARLAGQVTLEGPVTPRFPITASFGVTPCVAGDDLQSCTARVDRALYTAKAAGRNRVVVSVPGQSPATDLEAVVPETAAQGSTGLEVPGVP